MSTPKDHPYVLLFTGTSGERYGYEDRFLDNGFYSFTGEGTRGPMKWTKGNRALRDHIKDGKRVLLFEILKTGFVRLISEVRYYDYSEADRRDVDGATRKAIIFELELVEDSDGASTDLPIETGKIDEPNKKDDLEDLRRKALIPPPSPTTSKAAERARVAHIRSVAVKIYALKREEGHCPGCDKPAPFSSRRGPFLEVHHLDRIADGGPDRPEGVVAVCPNCHRKVHHGIEGRQLNDQLRQHVLLKEELLAKKAGRSLNN